tara:strand:- start:142945 stop:144147 length:1203 start_codon:yes stop_codon:yes gene_type:complete
MISILNQNGELVKVLTSVKDAEFGLHKLFGFITDSAAQKRIEARKLKGIEFNTDSWECKFKIKNENGKILLSDSENCSLESLNNEEWKITSKLGEFKLVKGGVAEFSDMLIEEKDSASWMNRLVEIFFLALFLMVPIIYFMTAEEVVPEDEKKKEDQITVRVIEKVNVVNIARESVKDIKVKPLTKAQKAHRAVQRNLGFLGMVGDKSLTKAVGGVPQKLKKATAGAGKGGDAGSGGELLTGLGKGLKKTTVGNTGVAGLGGVGTKGAGGGAGGYGNTVVASGEGAGISSISVSKSDMVLDGGLSRYAINATIAKYLSQIRRCYEEQLKGNPSLEGLVKIAFQIGGTGYLNYARVSKSSLNNKAAESCMTNKMMNWQFPKPKGGVNVNVDYPFLLRPVGK